METIEITYICFFLQKPQFECKAASMFEAKQKAIAHFKPLKSNRHMVHCHLADVAVDTANIGA